MRYKAISNGGMQLTEGLTFKLNGRPVEKIIKYNKGDTVETPEPLCEELANQLFLVKDEGRPQKVGE